MNQYLENLSKIEFAITYACNGRCKHCSEGDHELFKEVIDKKIAVDAVRKISREYGIKTAMVFGGEPLLFPDTVYAIIDAAREVGIPRRQVITNGCFSSDKGRLSEVARWLSECGVNDLAVSADAFHQEFLSLDTVNLFIGEAKKHGIPTRLQPAWLRSPDDDNPYNRKTREILAFLQKNDVPAGDGNVIFPEGNALKYLSAYFEDVCPENPYIEDPCNVKCISFSPNGDVFDGNIYKQDVMEIIKEYKPKR